MRVGLEEGTTVARTPDEDIFLRNLPDDGQRVGNYRLLEKLGWEEDKYWRIRDRLLDAGKVIVGRGRGGSVARVVNQSPAVLVVPGGDGVPKPPPAPVGQESDLYPPLLDTLQNQWGKYRRLDQFTATMTAMQGRRDTGGTWTRPDITGMSVRRYSYVQGVHFDLWTFEVKPSWAVTVAGVFEAAAHSKFATRSFVMYHVPSDDEPVEFSRCVDEATRFEIGLITFTNAADFGTWEVHLDAPRRSPDPEHLDEFIATQIPDDLKAELQRWLR